MTLYEKLRRLRGEAQMTQAEVAEKLNVTRQTISSYESGRTQPDVEMLKHLAEVYGVSVQELLCAEAEETDEMPSGRALRFLRITEGVFLLCALGRSVLLWTANRFYMVPEGQVSEEMKAVLETRWSLMDAARYMESVFLAAAWLLCVLVLIQSLQHTNLIQRLWVETGMFVGGLLLVTVPWALADPWYGFWNYDYMVVSAGVRVVIFLLAGTLTGRLKNKKVVRR